MEGEETLKTHSESILQPLVVRFIINNKYHIFDIII